VDWYAWITLEQSDDGDEGDRRAKHPSLLALVAVLGRRDWHLTALTQGYNRNGHIPTPVYFAAQAP